MNIEELEKITDYQWDLFCRRYPITTGRSILAKLWLLFSKDTARLLWENGFYQGWIKANETEN